MFAFWVAREGVELGDLPDGPGAEPRGWGWLQAGSLARMHGPRLGLDVATCYDYLTRILSYDLGEPELAGLTRFAAMAARLGLAPEGVSLVFHRRPRSCTAPLTAQRLSFDEGVELFRSASLLELGRAADQVCRRLHPEPFRTYNIDRNINYTNVCTAVCDFLRVLPQSRRYRGLRARSRRPAREDPRDRRAGGDQILMQGGLHPHLKLEWYEELLQDIKAHFPGVNVHGFSAPEIHHFTKVSKRPLREVLERLKAAGLGSLPGGGAEILVDRVRSDNHARQGDDRRLAERSPRLARAGGPLDGHDDVRPYRDARRAGRAFRAGAAACRTRRAASRRSSPGRFSPTIPTWPSVPAAGSFEYLKNQAISRLYLDNVPNIQSSWVTQGPKIGQVALFFGANDMGSLMIEENVVSSAGTVYHLSLAEIKRAIREAGYIPRQRNVFYEYIDRRAGGRLIEPSPVKAVRRLSASRARFQPDRERCRARMPLRDVDS